mgnify:CR=1 FL=1
MLVKVREFHRGLSGSSSYFYVLDGNRLVHISQYAVSTHRVSSDCVEYLVDLGRVGGKQVVEISSTNSGLICSAWVFPGEDLALEFSSRRVYEVSLGFLNKFDFAYLSNNERLFLVGEWRQYYLRMVNAIRELVSFLNGHGVSVYLQNLVGCQVSSEANYPLSFLIPYSGNVRRKSLENLCKQIHQVWIALRILAEFIDSTELATGFDKRAFISFEQSSYHPLYTIRCGFNKYSLWYEFDTNPHTMCRGMLWYTQCPALKDYYDRVKTYLESAKAERAPLRPDFVVLRNRSNCEDICFKGLETAIVIECKNQDYTYWRNQIDSQIIPYDKIFQPNAIVLASMKSIPKNVKTSLESYGLIVVDEVYPGGQGERKLLEMLKHYLL